MARKGLGKGLDSLFPDIYNEDFDSNSARSLEDMLKDEETTVENVIEDVESKEEEVDKDDQENSSTSGRSEEVKVEVQKDDDSSKDLHSDSSSKEAIQTSQEIQIQKEHVEEVKRIVNKNPRITLWSSRSSAVFRYLRKTEPEFSISKEASVLIDEAVSKKYPEIWALFDED